MEAQAPPNFTTYGTSAFLARFVNFTTTFQEQAPAGPFVNEGDNAGTVGNQQSRYFIAC